jgi:ornithine decarboxylase
MKEPQSFITTLEFSADIASKLKSITTAPSKENVSVSRRSVQSILKAGVSQRDIEELDSFYVCDLGEIVRQLNQWRELLPRVQPFFGIVIFNYSCQV